VPITVISDNVTITSPIMSNLLFRICVKLHEELLDNILFIKNKTK
jgi:hypothetical protein